MKKRDSDFPKRRARRPRVPLVLVVFAALTLAAVARAQTEVANAWTTSGPAGAAVLSLAMNPHDSAALFAGTEAGIFRSVTARSFAEDQRLLGSRERQFRITSRCRGLWISSCHSAVIGRLRSLDRS